MRCPWSSVCVRPFSRYGQTSLKHWSWSTLIVYHQTRLHDDAGGGGDDRDVRPKVDMRNAQGKITVWEFETDKQSRRTEKDRRGRLTLVCACSRPTFGMAIKVQSCATNCGEHEDEQGMLRWSRGVPLTDDQTRTVGRSNGRQAFSKSFRQLGGLKDWRKHPLMTRLI